MNGTGGLLLYRRASFRLTFYGPTGLYLDGRGNLYVADTLNMMIRRLQGNFVALDFKPPVRQFDKSTPMSQTIENDGNTPFDLTAFALDANIRAGRCHDDLQHG